MSREYELFPGFNAKSQPAFSSQEQYDQFRANFQKEIEPIAQRYAKAHAASELAARTHWRD